MALCTLLDVTHGYGGPPLLDGVSFQVDPGERVCLLGRNGAGKSTLMKLIAGEIRPDSGDVFRQPGARIARLAQEVPADVSGRVADVVGGGEAAEDEEDWERELRLEGLLERLGLDPGAEFGHLSGGLKRRVLLARALAGKPDLLLLDEPTNHLDVASIEWLEEFLVTAQPSLFFVTHDRAFLQRLATRIVELDRGTLTAWDCDYATYLVRKEAWLDAEERQRAAFDKKLAQEEAWVRKGVRAQRTRAVARIEALKRMRLERQARRERVGQAKLQVAEAERSGAKVVEAIGASFAYPGGGRELVRDLELTVMRGDKVGIVGPNGAGKTTLVRLLLGQLAPTRGEVRLGTRLEVLHLDQLRSQIDDAKTVAENVADGSDTVTVGGKTRHVIGYLQDFLFEPSRARSPARVLSGGERNRLLLARLFTKPANVLVLDEPTNDLDLETLDLLEDLLVEFDGTVLLVSHDRRFLDEVVTSTLVVSGDGTVRETVGGYADAVREFGAAAAGAARSPAGGGRGSRDAGGGRRPVEPVPAPAKLSSREKRELESLPARIEALEKEQAELVERLADPVLYQDGPASVARVKERLAAVEKEHAAAFARWETLDGIDHRSHG